jgi:hypothetical protein
MDTENLNRILGVNINADPGRHPDHPETADENAAITPPP